MGCMLCVFVFPRVMCELCHGEEGTPVVLSSCDELVEVGLYPLVHVFCLSIGSRVKCSVDVLLYPCCFANCSSKVTGESRISIQYNLFKYAEPGEEMLKIKLRYTLAIYGLITGQEFGGFGASLIYSG